MTRLFMLGLVMSMFSIHALAGPTPNQPTGPCKQIAEACQNAGFVKGDWKKGDGLWRDCVDPIVQGQTSVQGATKALPQVDPMVISACKAKRPKFGSGKVGSGS